MRCRVGDMALIVESCAGNEGKIVQCLELAGLQGCLAPDGQVEEGAVWRIDQMLPSWSGTLGHHILDSQLRPLRDPGPDEVDEMVKLLGAPEERTPVLVGQGAEA